MIETAVISTQQIQPTSPVASRRRPASIHGTRHVMRAIAAIAGLFLLVTHGYAETSDPRVVEGVDRLPNIVELRLLDDSRVFLRAVAERSLDRIGPDGGWIDDRRYIDADTGEIGELQNARAPNEIVLIVGERSQDGRENSWNTLELKSIEEGRSIFLLTGVGRDGKERNEMIAARPYNEDMSMANTNFQQMFELSRSQNKGLTLLVQGQTIAGLVISFSDELVEMRSQQYERIVVRIDRIDGIAYQ